ncbi:MAG: hypothetical protein J2P36_32050 [Ktedonobacteraceae bacterium]|nr:hypothetical protein [Ktedonobacteraceae bacterium]
MSSLFSWIFGNDEPEKDRLEIAEEHLRNNPNSGLIRHYHMDEVARNVEHKIGVKITGEEALDMVSRIREEQGYEPVKPYHMPGVWED